MPMSAPTTISDGNVVHFHYTLTDDEGDVIDTSSGREPLGYLQGAGNIVQGLEKQMLGHGVGDKFDAIVPPEDGYGARTRKLERVPRDAFPPDVELAQGTQLAAQDQEGKIVPLWVVEVGDDAVIVDPNHPLSGVELHFAIEITEIRDSTDEERAHGHLHGPGGHHH